MRKRNIKTVAHWVIMSILLLFPILMVGVSSFANDEQTVTVTETYEYQTNEVNTDNDLIQGNIYKFALNSNNGVNTSIFYGVDGLNFQLVLYGSYDISFSNSYNDFYLDDLYINKYWEIEVYNIENSINLYNGGIFINYAIDDEIDFIRNYTNNNYLYVVLLYIDYSTISQDLYSYFSASDYLGQVTTNVDIQNASYKQEVNNWCNGFKNLPVNQWYGQLLYVIGVGQTTNSVMNVIYVYPLYVLWVYIIDLIVDCLLVIIHFGHNALSRLGGDND